MFNLVSKALEIQESTSQSGTKSVKSAIPAIVPDVVPDCSSITIPEVGDSGADEAIQGDSCTNSDLPNFNNEEKFCEVKEKTRKMFNLVSKCFEEDAIAKAKKAHTAMRRKFFTDLAREYFPCIFCCVTYPNGESRLLDDDCDPQSQNLGRPQQADTLPVETCPPAVGIDGVDTAHLRLNQIMFSLVSKSLSVEGRDKVLNTAEERRLQKERALLASSRLTSCIFPCSGQPSGQPSCTPSSRSISPILQNDENVGLDNDKCCKMMRLVQKALGSDLCKSNPVKAKSAPPNVETKDFGQVMATEDFLILKQKSEQMLTIVVKAREGLCAKRAISMKAREQPRDAPPEVTVTGFTADVSSWWMMCATFCSGQKCVSREMSRDDVVEPVELADDASAGIKSGA